MGDPLPAAGLTRRRFTHLLGGSWALRSIPGAAAWSRSQLAAQGAEALWAFDVDGNGVIDASDRALVSAAVGTRRGLRVEPAEDWDYRTDVLAHGSVERAALARLDEILGRALVPRPLVACWHYGWYSDRRRRGEPASVRYLGGNYASSDRRTEETFNDLKQEFGITVDFLSWIDRPAILRAWSDGYLSARNRDRRRLALLYEGPINLGTHGRVDMSAEPPHAEKLRHDFQRMARWLVDAGGRAPLFRLDGRPVLYLFGSHTWGSTHRNLPHVGRALARAREAFAEEIGSPPYLIGDEALFPGDESPGLDRLARSAFFDAITRYHHYDERLVRRLGEGKTLALDAGYRRRIQQLEQATIDGFAGVRNRFTGAPLLVIPSSAAGFAKRGLPALTASREQYTALLRGAWQQTSDHLQRRHAVRLGTRWLPAPLVIVGSWNEEFEGHALMPSASNRALAPRAEDGFDWLNAIRSLYGWNHWSAITSNPR